MWNFHPFGNEVRFLDGPIETAFGKKFDFGSKKITKFILRFTGLPHLGARVRPYYLNKLLNDLNKPQKILDAGCGIGLNSFLAARKSFTVIGIDNAPKKILHAKKMLANLNYRKINFYLMTLTKLKFKDKSFDAVICFEVLEHIQKDNKALSEISRVLKKNGSLFLSTPGIGLISKLNKKHKHHIREGYSLLQLKNLLKANNLRIKKIIKVEHTPLGFMLRYINDEIHRRSLLLAVLIFPIFFPLAILDGFLPSIIKPNNWILVASKNSS